MEGRAEAFERLPDELFYRFRLSSGGGYVLVRGPERLVFDGKVISPAFTTVEVDWASGPLTRVYGRRDSPNEVTAYIVYVKLGDLWRCWSYRPVIDNRALGLLSRYKKLATSEPEVKEFWFSGTLAGCDLLSVLRNPEGKPVEVPEDVVEKEAMVKGILKGRVGEIVEPIEIYVKGETGYRRL